jgi:putative transcriptional regulator
MKSTGKTYRSDPLRSIHLAMKCLHKVGAIDKTTMRDFDVACLTTVSPLSPEEVKRIREKFHMSQATFAMALNVTAAVVSKWERGEKRPSGPSLKLLSLADKKGIETIL